MTRNRKFFWFYVAGMSISVMVILFHWHQIRIHMYGELESVEVLDSSECHTITGRKDRSLKITVMVEGGGETQMLVLRGDCVSYEKGDSLNAKVLAGANYCIVDNYPFPYVVYLFGIALILMIILVFFR